ncbi:MAG TPA: biopolymer transporter ExbD [Opitutaceae bacterium]|nr:biopolymer transporter ExbD [Opitutaceae bacterium]
MAGSSGGTSKGGVKKARIEIIPLIDVIFFLLATFVLFTLSLNKSAGPTVVLPQSATGIPRDPAGSATITVTEEATIAWDKDFINGDEFLARLRAFYLKDPNAKILINGDENAKFSQAIYVFDEVRKAGFEKVLIETRVRPREAQ